MLFSRTRAVHSISPREAGRRSDLRIIDVRTRPEWRAGHAPKARHIPLDELPGRLSELEAGRPVAFVCQSGARSKRAAKLAARAGIDALNIEGGMLAWQRSGLSVTSR
jgi:rhodanese-related sulfurtransferase